MDKRTIVEEIFNAITHGIGLLFSITGLVILLIHSLKTHNTVMTVCFVIFGVSCILVFLSSTLYHSLMGTSAKHVFRKIDHSVIFLYIAGSYTPLIMFTLHNAWSWIVLTGVWFMALIGIVVQLFKKNNFKLSIFLYLFFGWFAVFISKPLLSHLPLQIIMLILTGGILYTVGTIFYLMRKLYFHHVIWHLFVMAGGYCHYLAMYYLK